MKIILDGNDLGYRFDGIGAVSAGASTRLLPDYPEQQRNDILDLLFKPKFGASLQHLKIETGGDVNSTLGTEPAILRTLEEYNDTAAHIDDPEYMPNIKRFQRGYEFWFAREARDRNPGIRLDCLQWGAPEWVRNPENGSHYSQNNANMLTMFLKGAKAYWGLDFDYVGGSQNEYIYDSSTTSYIKLLRRILDTNGLENIKIVVADTYYENYLKAFEHDLQSDPELWNAVYAVGTHYPCVYDGVDTPAADFFLYDVNNGKPAWASEHGAAMISDLPPIASTFEFALVWAHAVNHDYIKWKITNAQLWPPISAFYNCFIHNKSGLINAPEPWSGYYTIYPSLWATAHTTQFAEPGWVYLGGTGCGNLDGGGSYVTLKNPQTCDYSTVIETKGADVPQVLDFNELNLPAAVKHVWRTHSSDPAKWFIQIDDNLTGGCNNFTLTVEPDSIYTITTTTGQQKGVCEIPGPMPLSLAYHESFEDYKGNAKPRYFSNWMGYFEVISGDGTDGSKCLEQKSTGQGVSWMTWEPDSQGDPITYFGDPSWSNYSYSVDAKMLGTTGMEYVILWGRLLGREGCGVRYNYGNNNQDGFYLKIFKSGSWEFHKVIDNNPNLQLVKPELIQDVQLGFGTIAGFDGDAWHIYKLVFNDHNIDVQVDGNSIVDGITDMANEEYLDYGMVALGCSKSVTRFDNISIEPI